MKKIVIALMLFVTPMLAGAAGGGGGNLMHAGVDQTDQASLQRGAKLFVNYCMGCHSAQYMRYSRVAKDLGLSEDLVEKYLIFTGGKIGDTMISSMSSELATGWFGQAPPDLSLITRVRGEDWVYTFLNSFYRDENSPIGVNNVLKPGLSMPHVLWELQGMPELAHADAGGGGHGSTAQTEVPEGSEGLMTQEQYRQATRDLTNFLSYVGEPVQAERRALGIKVLLFLAVFLFVAYLLKKEYWKDVH